MVTGCSAPVSLLDTALHPPPVSGSQNVTIMSLETVPQRNFCSTQKYPVVWGSRETGFPGLKEKRCRPHIKRRSSRADRAR